MFFAIPIFLLSSFMVLGISNFKSEAAAKNKQGKIAVLVLPPYDEIANAGLSPNARELIEASLKDENISVMAFPFKKLMNVPYLNVFDKKYCAPILEKVKADIIIMSKINQATRNGNIEDDKWNLRIKIFNSKNNRQMDSKVRGNNLSPKEMQTFLLKNRKILISEIENYR